MANREIRALSKDLVNDYLYFSQKMREAIDKPRYRKLYAQRRCKA